MRNEKEESRRSIDEATPAEWDRAAAMARAMKPKPPILCDESGCEREATSAIPVGINRYAYLCLEHLQKKRTKEEQST